MAEVSLHPKGSQAVSPVRAPFGSILFSEKVPPLQLHDFVAEVEASLIKRGLRKITLSDPPLFYRPWGQLLHTILLNRGYQVTHAHVSAGIPISQTPFYDKIDVLQKRKLKKTRTRGYSFRPIQLKELKRVYDFLLATRQQRGYTLSMTYEELHKTVKALKKSFFLFGVFRQDELTAGCIAIQVSPTILYDFYHGHHEKYDPVSPVVMLTEGLYDFCAANKMTLLDLGTSSIGDQINFSLLEFKLRLGAVPSGKLTFEKVLS